MASYPKPSRDEIMARARDVDPECWNSYSGQTTEFKRYIEKRRTEAMSYATEMLHREAAQKHREEEEAALPENRLFAIANKMDRGCFASSNEVHTAQAIRIIAEAMKAKRTRSDA